MLDFQRGSLEAFEELFAHYRNPLWGFFRRRLTLHDSRCVDCLAFGYATRTFRALLIVFSISLTVPSRSNTNAKTPCPGLLRTLITSSFPLTVVTSDPTAIRRESANGLRDAPFVARKRSTI